jgi:hypothetical protein
MKWSLAVQMELTILVMFRLDEHGRCSDNESFSRTILGDSEARYNLELAALRMNARLLLCDGFLRRSMLPVDSAAGLLVVAHSTSQRSGSVASERCLSRLSAPRRSDHLGYCSENIGELFEPATGVDAAFALGRTLTDRRPKRRKQ